MSSIKGVVLTETERPVAVETKNIARPKVEQYRGLCSVCSNAPTCTYRRKFGEPILFCDEHEVSINTPKTNADGEIRVQTRSPRNERRVKEKDTGKYRGLCRDCENREHCTYPKPEGGVWHCEEYK
jgi:hypothetical protein